MNKNAAGNTAGQSVKVSIVIPVYNVEEYLGECLDSVLAQTLRDVEIICVNDGSTDGSRGILADYAEKDARILIVDKPNGGLSSARNAGLSRARGEYVYYLDSDDKIIPGAMEHCATAADAGELDVLFFEGSMLFESEEIRKKHPNLAQYYERKNDYAGLMDGKAYFTRLIENKDFVAQVAMQFARRSFLLENDLHNEDGILHEDNPYTFLVMMRAARLMHSRERLFVYRVRTGSITTVRKTVKHAEGHLAAIRIVLRYLEEEPPGKRLRRAAGRFLDDLLYAAAATYAMIETAPAPAGRPSPQGADPALPALLFLTKAVTDERAKRTRKGIMRSAKPTDFNDERITNRTGAGTGKGKALLIAGVLNAAILMIVLMMSRMIFDTNDDMAIGVFVAKFGYFNIGFSNYYLNAFVYGLQQILPMVNAWTFLQVALSFIAFTSISFVFLAREISRLNFFMAALIPAIFCFDHYLAIQFTKTSGLLAAAGAVICLSAVLRNKQKPLLILGGALLFFGAGYRFDNYYFIIGLSAVSLVFYAAAHTGFSPKRALLWLGERKFALGAFVLIILGVFAAQWASDAQNSSTQELRDYFEYNAARAGYTDYDKPLYAEAEGFYESLGISQNDYDALNSWYQDYGGAASIENFDAINALRKDDRPGFLSGAARPLAGAVIDSIREHNFRGIHFLLIFFFAAFGILLFNRKWVVPSAAACAVVIAGFCYLFYIGRPIYRATYVMELAPVLWLLFFADPALLRPRAERVFKAVKRILNPRAVLLAALVFVFAVSYYLDARHDEPQAVNGDILSEYTSAHPENLYVFDIFTNGWFDEANTVDADPLRPYPEGFRANYVSFGGWPTKSPFFLERGRQFGVENFYEDIIDKENIFVVDCWNTEIGEKYFNEHYAKPGEEIYYDAVEDVNGFKIWQVKTRPAGE
ncbi:MAG: glycosyltransferase [Clostridiales Family XIII bacterium]|jgi:glycosyltransferase involved in cell wall biosynthesis/MFS family permease|nr:glycosyltransferase [Clostridiales Family XIII bacterium]